MPSGDLNSLPLPLIFPAAHRRWSYWVRPYSNCYATMSSSPTVRPPRPLCCLLWLCSYLSCFWSTPNTHSQVWLGGYLIHHWSTPTTLSHPSASCGYLTYPWRMPTMHALLPAVATWLLTNPWSTHTTPSQVWLCGYLTHTWSTPTTPTSLPLPAVATWLSHLSLEYAHHAQPGVAMWLSHPSLEYAHHAHLSASASCGYVAISLIPGVRTPRPARCGYVAISPIPEVRPPRPLLCLCQLWLRGYLTYPGIMPTTPTLLPAVATWLLFNPWSTHTTPSQMCLSHLSLEYAHHAHPLPAVATWLSHLSLENAYHTRSSTSCGYATKPWSTPNAPSHLRLCGHLPYPLNTPSTPTLCQRRLCSHLIYPWSTPILLPAAATRNLTWPWNTPTTPSQPQVWWLCGHLTFHQLGFSG